MLRKLRLLRRVGHQRRRIAGFAPRDGYHAVSGLAAAVARPRGAGRGRMCGSLRRTGRRGVATLTPGRSPRSGETQRAVLYPPGRRIVRAGTRRSQHPSMRTGPLRPRRVPTEGCAPSHHGAGRDSRTPGNHTPRLTPEGYDADPARPSVRRTTCAPGALDSSRSYSPRIRLCPYRDPIPPSTQNR